MAEIVIAALDQGTTSTRAMLFDASGQVVASAQQPFAQHYPADGWVEHDPDDLWQTSLACLGAVAAQAGARPIAALGITNQRETTIVWHRASGRPVHRAIVWQDRRTAAACDALVEAGHRGLISARTGLLADPYFSATKIAWILDNVPGARAMAEAGELAFGTVDTWLLWNLTGGRVHATDATNAARTLLFDIHRGRWDEDLCALFGVPMSMLPQVQDTVGPFGVTAALGRSIPITGVAGDQQAAAIGQVCLDAGEIKSTYGTGCFVLVNTGATAVTSQHRMLTTVAASVNARRTYALEGAIFNAGTVVQWLRDNLRLFRDNTESGALAAAADPASQVYLVPAFTGLGAPYWNPHARGAFVGLTRDAGVAEIVKAGLESVAFQTRDLTGAIAADMAAARLQAPSVLRIDGGMAANDWFCQRLADILGIRVERPHVTETTALGAAFAAGLGAGLFSDLSDVGRAWRLDRAFVPAWAADRRDAAYAGWQAAVARVL